jgi:hypothetical protein
MLQECQLFDTQLQKWIQNNPNWVSGATVIQAVTKTLPLSMEGADI